MYIVICNAKIKANDKKHVCFKSFLYPKLNRQQILFKIKLALILSFLIPLKGSYLSPFE